MLSTHSTLNMCMYMCMRREVFYHDDTGILSDVDFSAHIEKSQLFLMVMGSSITIPRSVHVANCTLLDDLASLQYNTSKPCNNTLLASASGMSVLACSRMRGMAR
eukprot:Platyproteum_vivax@DN2661_c0_g1_i2.p1